MRMPIPVSVAVLGLVAPGALSLAGSRPVPFGVALAAAKPTSNPGVKVTFADRSTDMIRSDGAPYVDGTGGVVGQIFVSGSGDMTLNLNKTRPIRSFAGIYSRLSPGAPNGAFTDGWFINVHGVWQMLPGDTIATGASFSTGVGDFRWCPEPAPPTSPPWCQSTNTQAVTVTRDSFEHWTVVADPAVNDLDVLIKFVRGSWQVLGQYHMPFKLTIECSQLLCQ